MDWASANQVLDEVVITAGIVFLVVRQFLWRSAQLHKMLRLPVLIMTSGLIYLSAEVWSGVRWVPGDWLIVVELMLVIATGTAMGHVTRFRVTNEHLQYKLSLVGVWLWALFLVVRVATFFLASALGADFAGATGLVLLSFGANRLAAILVVRRRAGSALVGQERTVIENAS